MSGGPDDVVDHFDHYDQQFMADPYPGYAVLRERCPIAHSDRHGGFYVVSKLRDVSRIAQQYDVFSSDGDALAIPPNQARPLPITVDPPLHHRYRTILAAYFSPRRVERMEPDMRVLANELIDGFIADGAVDIAERYASALPTIMLARMLGVPFDDTHLFHHWIDVILYGNTTDPQASAGAAAELQQYVIRLLVDTAGREDDTFLSVMRNTKPHDGPLREDEMIRMVVQLIFGALHTTAYLINGALLMLDDDRTARSRLIAEPSLLELATEEFLRLISPVQMLARKVARPAECLGQQFAPDDRVMLVWASANRDQEIFDRPDELVLDRFPNRHVAFGVGIHRCVGAPLGRTQFRVCVGELLRRIPNYSIPDRASVAWGLSSTRGINRLPIEW